MKKKLLLLISIVMLLLIASQTKILAEGDNTYYTVEINSVTEDGSAIESGVAQISGLPLGGQVQANTEYSFTVYDNDIYEFSYWKVDGEKVNNSNNVLTRSYAKDTVIDAVFSFVGNDKALLNVTSTKPFSVKTEKGIEEALFNNELNEYTYNNEFDNLSSIELLYDNEEEDFTAWSDSNKNVLSLNNNYGFNITNDTNIVLNTFKADEGTYLAQFCSLTGKVLSTVEFSDVETLLDNLPTTTPSKIGSDFENWLLGNKKLDNTITMNDIKAKASDSTITLKPSFKESDTQATITVINTVDDADIKTETKKCRIGDTVKFVAGKVNGKTFINWSIKENDKLIPISLSASYTYHVIGDKTIYAVYSSAKQHKTKASIGISNIFAEDGNKIFFEVSRNIPNDSELGEHGIMYYTNEYVDISSYPDTNLLKIFSFEGFIKNNIGKFVGGNTDKNNSFGMHMNVKDNVNSKVCLRGYAVVDGVTIYTPVYVVTYNGLKNNEYRVAVPMDLFFDKGDIISLNDGKEYKILGIDGTQVKVMSVDNVIDSQKYYESMDLDNNVTDFDGQNGAKYAGSALDDSLTNWYNSLNTGDTVPMYNAIQYTTIAQFMYKDDAQNPTYKVEQEFGGGTLGISRVSGYAELNSYVYAPEIKDIYDYYGTDTVTAAQINELFFNQSTAVDASVALSSAFYETANAGSHVWLIYGQEGSFRFSTVTSPCAVRAIFNIDLTATGVEYEDASNTTRVTYINEKGEEEDIRLPSATIIKFDAGKYGSYTTTPSNILLSEKVYVDLTNDEYIPTANEGFKFVGFVFDKDNNKLIAQYTLLSVAKGDIITLNDGKKYRILSIDGTNAKVFSLSDETDIKYNENPDSVEIITGTYIQKYEGSTLDTTINDWYNSLANNDDTKPMHDAIQKTNVVQHGYECVDVPDDATDFVTESGIAKYKTEYHNDDEYDNFVDKGNVTVGERYAYQIDFDDIFDYYGVKALTTSQLQDFFFNTQDPVENTVWLLSSTKNFSSQVYVYSGCEDDCYVAFAQPDDRLAKVRPTFTINLAYDGVDFTVAE